MPKIPISSQIKLYTNHSALEIPDFQGADFLRLPYCGNVCGGAACPVSFHPKKVFRLACCVGISDSRREEWGLAAERFWRGEQKEKAEKIDLLAGEQKKGKFLWFEWENSKI